MYIRWLLFLAIERKWINRSIGYKTLLKAWWKQVDQIKSSKHVEVVVFEVPRYELTLSWLGGKSWNCNPFSLVVSFSLHLFFISSTQNLWLTDHVSLCDSFEQIWITYDECRNQILESAVSISWGQSGPGSGSGFCQRGDKGKSTSEQNDSCLMKKIKRKAKTRKKKVFGVREKPRLSLLITSSFNVHQV